MGEANPDSLTTMHSTKRVRISLSHCVKELWGDILKWQFREIKVIDKIIFEITASPENFSEPKQAFWGS